MSHEDKKITLLTNELMMMLLLNGVNDINIDIKKEPRLYTINIIAKNCGFTDLLVERIKYTLEAPRQYELEDYYWQLAGDNENVEELFLVGIMTDTAKVYMQDKHLYIELTRKK